MCTMYIWVLICYYMELEEIIQSGNEERAQLMETKKKKKQSWKQWIAVGFCGLIGACCGILMVKYIDLGGENGKSLGEQLFSLAIPFVVMYVAMFAHLVIHEAGHLVFGLATGYRFCSFRIGSFMWMKKNGKICLKRLSLAGTGGQCLMAPPEYKDGKIPVGLYNMGGSLFNVFAAILCLLLYLSGKGENLFSVSMFLGAIVGIVLALMNGLPLRMGVVDNDGYNALSLGKNEKALRSFWIQMKMGEEFANGARLKDLPQEWFVCPNQEERKNSMVAALAVFSCNRLMDEHRFEEAYGLMKELLNEENGIVGLHRNLLLCDCIYCEAIGEKDLLTIEKWNSQELQNFMKSMKTYPSILRTQYVYALLVKKDMAEAAKFMEKFDQCAKSYPYASEIQGEQELMEIARQAAAPQQV